MNKQCTFTTDKCSCVDLVAISATDNEEPPFLGITPEHGVLAARLDGDDLLVDHPHRGWCSRPLEGAGSWHVAWDNDQIEIWICGEKIENFSALTSLTGK